MAHKVASHIIEMPHNDTNTLTFPITENGPTTIYKRSATENKDTYYKKSLNSCLEETGCKQYIIKCNIMTSVYLTRGYIIN